MAMPDGFVCGQLLDFTDGRIRPAPEILHRQWSERHPGSSHCFSHLVLLPPVGLISRVARLLSSPIDGIPLEGSGDGHVQAQVLPICACKRDQQVGGTPVEARQQEPSFSPWIQASRLGQPDEPLSQGVVSGNRLPSSSADEGVMSEPVGRLMVGRALHVRRVHSLGQAVPEYCHPLIVPQVGARAPVWDRIEELSGLWS